MKKVLSILIFAMLIAFTNSVSAVAGDVYSFSEGDIDYYAVSNSGGTTVSPENAVAGVLVGYKNGKEINRSIWGFYCSHVNNEVFYEIYDENQNVLAKGKVKDDPVVIKVLASVLEKGK